MSCFVVAKAHIDALLTAGMAQHHRGESWLSWFSRELTEEEERSGYAVGAPWGPGSVAIAERLRRELAPETADEVGQMLWDENRISYAHRYGEQAEFMPYRYERLGGPLAAPPSAVQTLKAIDCYEYQSCEHPSWHVGEAKRFCDALRRRMISRLDGYDEADWEIGDHRAGRQ